MNLGPALQDAVVGNFSAAQRKALGTYPEMLDEARKRGHGLFLWGPNGTGKSYVAAALCKRARGQFRISAYSVSAFELKEAWIKDVPASEDFDETRIERVQKVQFLVIDDVGKEHRAKNSGFAENQLDALLRHRHKWLLSTVITTNLDPGEFRDIYGVSASDLCREAMMVVPLEGQSLRSDPAHYYR